MSARRARSGAASPPTPSRRGSTTACCAWSRAPRPWSSRSPTARPRPCCSRTTTSSASSRASTCVLRDDKSFPYIVIRRDTEWPQLAKHRGVRDPKNEYFGPFASATAVNRTLYALQRALPAALVLRRRVLDPHPALPAVPDPALHGALRRPHRPHRVRRHRRRGAGGFLGGRNREVQQALSQRMDQASVGLEFERAAGPARPHPRAGPHPVAPTSISLPSSRRGRHLRRARRGRPDVRARCSSCAPGRNLGNRAYFPSHTKDLDEPAVLVGLHRPVLPDRARRPS